ncbi:Agamous-like MADS-box protein [Melia azedarach]|uniref:Agamous-like MADS-box protein n=2 Tax=Melia azedarach TaxID=155640 RepID=A0ACC1X6M3_MELAZ|nr:Agamous-like MADS-box protein [Melia azedarach]KAJ4707046.1 Agamous-like MADS-box protein [Melia azedarach]
MDGQPQKLEPIKHEKARLATFKKRKGSLMKKVHEFSTLCDVEVCIIIYGPKLKSLPVKPETWASREGKLIDIIRKYKKTTTTADDAQRRSSLSLSKVGKNKAPQVEDDDATRLRKKKCVAKYTTWDQRMDNFTEDQLKMVIDTMDHRLKLVDKKLKMFRGGRKAMKKAASRKLLDHDYSHSDADTHQKHDAKPLNLELTIGLQPHNQVSQELLPSDSS